MVDAIARGQSNLTGSFRKRACVLAKRLHVGMLRDMETIATVAEIAEAQLIRSVLEGHGITAVIPDEQTAEIAPPYLWATGGIRVQVAEEDAATAREVLATLEDDNATNA